MASVVAILRSLVPVRPLTYDEALRVAERQATWLLKLAGIDEPPVPEGVVTALPRFRVDRVERIPVSGSAHWVRGRWQIVLNAGERTTRQRYSLMHEFKHVLDNPLVDTVYRALPGLTSHDRAELACDYFAACVLMPKPWVRRAWGPRGQDVSALARTFRVSRTAMHIRLVQMDLLDPPTTSRSRSVRGRRPYRRTRGLGRLEAA